MTIVVPAAAGTALTVWERFSEEKDSNMANENTPNTEAKPHVEHPDSHEINDWFLFGPKNSQIEELVRELTLVHGLRLCDVEGLIVAALEERHRFLTNPSVQPEGG